MFPKKRKKKYGYYLSLPSDENEDNECKNIAYWYINYLKNLFIF